MMGTAYPMKVSDALLTTALEVPRRAIDLVTSWSYASTAAKPSFPGPGMWLHGSARALMRRMQDGAPGLNLFHHEFSVCDRYRGGDAAAQRVTCPVHFVLGRADQMTLPKAARDLAQALKAKVHVVEAGHNLMSEAPDAVLAALRQALSAETAATA
jgi:pimeloyl-ACP methyl ester carboxylesterase